MSLAGRSQLEKGCQPKLSRHQDGYPAIADFISSDADGETFVFRKFANLSARRLLHLESELVELEDQQRALDEKAASSTDPTLRLSLRSWSALTSSARTRPEERERFELARQIDVTLQQYHEALLLQSRISRLERPSDAAVRACRLALHGPDHNDAKLGGAAQSIFDEQYEQDLVALAPNSANDLLSQFLKRHWVFQKRDAADKKDIQSARGPQVRYFASQSLTLLADICSMLIAALLLIGPILALYFVTDPDARLGLVVAFIAAFAIGLSVSTGAKRDAIFAATAAYTTVLVVFVSGDLGNARPGQKEAG